MERSRYEKGVTAKGIGKGAKASRDVVSGERL